ncbi:glycosyltransferase [Arthrobacter sp. UYEF20]|uniref:glycosyltransferase n=1 Tax=Arthrobacter sp. UYEF20 TaxID=1756363 RepID=UPI003397EC5C
MQPSDLRLRLVVPGNVRHNSGGNVYNAALARELSALGAAVQTCPLDGDWPGGSPADRRRLAALLHDSGDAGGSGDPGGTGRAGDCSGDTGPENSGADNRITLVDGLLACGAPEELAAAAAAGRPAWILLHMPLGGPGLEGAGLERRALREAAGVICTSRSAAAGIRARHGLEVVTVALPGTEPAPLARGSEPPHLLAVAALLPNKDQSLLLAALARLTGLPWTASLIGSDSADPAYAAQLRDTAALLGLQDRVSIPGELRGEALEAEWAAADLSLLISRAETYGLVVTESIARGIPVVVRAGTGAVEALAAGSAPRQKLAIPPGTAAAEATALPGTAVALGTDPSALAEVLRRWLTEPALRARWRAGAAAARHRLPGWETTARTVFAALATAPRVPRPRDNPPELPAADDSPAAQAVGQ